MIQDDVQEMLERRSADVSPDPEAWQRIVERLETVPMTAADELAPRRSRRLLAVAAAAAVALGAGVAVQTGALDESGLLEAAAPPDRSEQPTTTLAAPPAQPALAPVWPATTDAEIEALQAAAGRGERSDLTDARAVAAAYLSERLTTSFSVGLYSEASPGTGQVKYESPVGSGRGGVVDVRRTGADGSIWVVTGSMPAQLAVHMVGYDGTDLTGELTSEVGGTLELTIRSSDGSDPVSTEQLRVEARRPISLRQTFAGKPGLVLLLRLDELLAEIRVEAPGP